MGKELFGDPQWIGLVLSITSILVNLWTRATVSELKNEINQRADDRYVSLDTLVQLTARIENLERAQIAALAEAVRNT
jgi:hypothetical protein